MTLDEAIGAIRALSEHVPRSVTDGSAPGWLRQRSEGRQDGLRDALALLGQVSDEPMASPSDDGLFPPSTSAHPTRPS
jgi:hypothetical protein